MTRLIVYPGGCYGNFLEWSLKTFSLDIDIVLPFDKQGTSHLSKINSMVKHYLNNHHENLHDPANLDMFSYHMWYYDISIFDKDKFVIVTNSPETEVLIKNNRFERLDYLNIVSKFIKRKNIIKKNHNLKTDCSIRNFLFKYSFIHDDLEIANYNKIPDRPNILKIKVHDLITNYTDTILKCIDHFDLIPSNNIAKNQWVYSQWISNQRNILKDSLIGHIIEKFHNRQNIRLDNLDLTLMDQVILIHRLKNHIPKDFIFRFLDHFPTELKEIYDTAI